MGLDMYLVGKTYIRKNTYNSNREPEENKVFKELWNALNLPESEILHQDPYGVAVEINLGYWRKANAIHDWFVQNVQDGTDDCGSYPVDNEQLAALREACKTVLKEEDNPDAEFRTEIANSYLPPVGGFFYGSTDIDEWYYHKLKYTVAMIDELLSEAYSDYSFEYTSSW